MWAHVNHDHVKMSQKRTWNNKGNRHKDTRTNLLTETHPIRWLSPLHVCLNAKLWLGLTLVLYSFHFTKLDVKGWNKGKVASTDGWGSTRAVPGPGFHYPSLMVTYRIYFWNQSRRKSIQSLTQREWYFTNHGKLKTRFLWASRSCKKIVRNEIIRKQ